MVLYKVTHILDCLSAVFIFYFISVFHSQFGAKTCLMNYGFKEKKTGQKIKFHL